MAYDSGARPGWYADPLRRFELRYYNGTTWTADVSSGGVRYVDPLGIDIGPRSPQQAVAGASTSGVRSTNRAATVSMVLGIIAIATAWLPFVVVLGVAAAVSALVFGIVGFRRSVRSGAGRSRAIVGVITGACALPAAALGALLTFTVLDAYDAFLHPGAHDAAITSCEIVGSRAVASGTLTNLGTDDADFSVLVGFVRPGTDNPHRTSRALLEDVAPGASSGFQVERQVDLDDVDCIVIEVTGPLPFGLALD